VSATVRWVGIIVGLLIGNAVGVAVLIATSSGEARRRVLPDYYERAAAWDETMAEAQASVELGWRLDVVVRGRELDVSVVDRAGAPVTDAALEVQVIPRGHVDDRSGGPGVTIAPGVYRVALAGRRVGLHDVALRLERGGQRFVADRLIEIEAPGS
jgi:nitrogen fixation protein FixH